MKKYIGVIFLFISTFGFAQVENSAGDVIDYREVDGKIIVKAMVNGVFGDFILDIAGHCTIMKSELTKYKIDSTSEAKFTYKEFRCRKFTPKSSVLVDNINVGSVASKMLASFFVLDEEPYLRELGVIGTIDASIFLNTVLTIDTKRKKITVTAPFRPPYMRLDHRKESEMMGSISTFNVMIEGKECNVTLDTWNSAAVSLTSEDFDKYSVGKKDAKNGVLSINYGKDIPAEKQFTTSDILFVKTILNDVVVVENSFLKKSCIGLDFLKEGVVSLDFAKGKIYFQPHGLMAIDDSTILPKEVVIENGKLNSITANYFKDEIYDYSKGGEFISKSDKVYVIDFWATWCGPCMGMMPQMEALAAKYKDRVIFCKVNADKEKELCNAFSIRALPTLFFIPAGGKPIIELGAKPESFVRIIEEMLK